MIRRKIIGSIREIVFGVEDGLVSTLGVVAAVAGAAVSNKIIILAGLASLFAGGISMMAGTYLSSKSVEEAKQHSHSARFAARASGVMGLSFMLAAIVPILPFVFLPIKFGVEISVIITALALFSFGAYKTKLTKRSPLRSGFEMAVVGLGAAAVGYLIGYVFNLLA